MKKLFPIIILSSFVLLCLRCQHELPLPAGTRLDSTIEKRVEALLAQMTLDQKIGQMTQVDRGFLEKEEDIQIYYLGSLLSGGDAEVQDDGTVLGSGSRGVAVSGKVQMPGLLPDGGVRGVSEP